MTRMESKHFVSLLFLVNFIFYYIIQAIPKVLFSVNIFNNFVYLCVEKYLANPLSFHSWFTSEIVNSSRKVKNLVRSQNKFCSLKIRKTSSYKIDKVSEILQGVGAIPFRSNNYHCRFVELQTVKKIQKLLAIYFPGTRKACSSAESNL